MFHLSINRTSYYHPNISWRYRAVYIYEIYYPQGLDHVNKKGPFALDHVYCIHPSLK